MKQIEVNVVRVYLMESSHLLNKIVAYLQKEVKIRGMTVFRATEGFGSGGAHNTSILALSLNAPLTVEFFDDDLKKTLTAIEHLAKLVKPEHIISWSAATWMNDEGI